MNLIQPLPPTGLITDLQSHPQSRIALGLQDLITNTVITDRITDPKGRYRFLVPPGYYQLVLVNPNYQFINPPSQLVFDTRHRFDPTVINPNLSISQKR